MENIKKSLLGLLLLSGVILLEARHAHWHDFNEIEDLFENQMEQMRKNMKSLRKIPKSSAPVSFKENDTNVVITILGIDTEELSATLNNTNDQLSIITPENRITISVRDNMIGIETMHEKKELKEKTKKDADDETMSAQYIRSAYASISQTVSAPLVLEKQTIDYDQENKELTITIPKQELKKGTAVPINKIGKKKSQAESEHKPTLDEEK